MYLPHEAIVVNTARGECLNNDALLTMLQKGQLRGAGLDVLPGDNRFQFGSTSALLQQTQQAANIILTPHIAGSTKDAWNMTQRHVIDQVKDILT
jgi:phosphoglycerate dehydrogenase-like enzyme